MNRISSELLRTIAEVLRRAFPQLQSNANPTEHGKPISGIVAFVGNLLANSGLLGFLNSGQPEGAVLRGSLVGLASGVNAVTEEDAAGQTTVTQKPCSAALTVSAYVVGGIIAAMLFRRIQQAAQRASS